MSSREPYVLFRAGERAYALPGARVVEVMRHAEVGDLPLVDLQQLHGGDASAITWRTCVVVTGVRHAGEALLVGLIADEARDVVMLAADELLAPPDFGPRVALRYLSSLVRDGDRFAIVLDPDGLVTRSDVERMLEAVPA